MSIEELNKHYRLQGRRHTGGTYCACVLQLLSQCALEPMCHTWRAFALQLLSPCTTARVCAPATKDPTWCNQYPT